jgi:hypothetical protein
VAQLFEDFVAADFCGGGHCVLILHQCCS